MAVQAVTGEDGDERTAKRCRRGSDEGKEVVVVGGGGWHPRTNKCLFRILDGTPLQRVWFPGSTALLMHPPPSPPPHPPPELKNLGGGFDRTTWYKTAKDGEKSSV